jgi:hypothetical protein
MRTGRWQADQGNNDGGLNQSTHHTVVRQRQRRGWPAGAGDGAGDGRLLDGVSGAVLEPDESAHGIRWTGLGQCWRPDARSAVKHRPADLVPQPLVVKYELTDRHRELVTLPPALRSPRGLALAFRRGSPCCLDRVRGSAKLVRGDVRNGPGLARSVGGIPCCSTQVSGRTHRMATRGASLHHLDLATHPGAGMLDRLTRSRVLGLSRLEKVKNVLCARCRPQSEEMVIRVGEGPTAADRHETRVSDLREDHGKNFYHCIRPTL